MILAQGPLFKQRGVDAYRATIRLGHGRTYIVSYQYFPNYPALDNPQFGSGYYCGSSLKLAMFRFAKMVKEQSDYVDDIEGEYP